MKALPKSRSDCITPEKLLPWMMKLVGFGSSHYQRIVKLNRHLENSSKLLERSTSQSVAAAIIYLYLCLNPDYMKQLGITKTSFAKKVQLSSLTVI